MSTMLTLLFKMLAAGDFGAWPKAAYWWLAGKKTAIGAIFGALWGLLAWGQSSGFCGARGWDCTSWSDGLFYLATGMITWGLFDGALRADPPTRPNKLDVLAKLVLVALMLPALGCVSANGGITTLRPKGIDFNVVRERVCAGSEAEAESYILLRGGGQAEQIEMVSRARQTCPEGGKR